MRLTKVCRSFNLLLILVCTSLMIAPAPASSSLQSPGWQRYTAQGFSVMLPQPPTTLELSLPRNVDERERPAWLFTAYEDRVAYVVIACENKNNRIRLSRFIEEVHQYGTAAKAENFDNDLSGEGFSGKQYSFATTSRMNGVVRFYHTKNKVYIVQVLGENIETAAVKTFFDSFAIGDDSQAVQITYTTGELTEPPATSGNSEALEIYSTKQLTTRPRILFKPEPMYTEDARRNQVVGTVVLRAVFNSAGNVESLRVVKPLPHGLTERAVVAARSIRFIPATKDGRPVGMHLQLEYNFNLY